MRPITAISLFVLTFAISLSTSYAYYDHPDITLSENDFSYHNYEVISFDVLDANDKGAVDISINLGKNEFVKEYTIDNYAGFECEVTESQAVEGQQGERGHWLQVVWSPGGDLSGCYLEISLSEQKGLLLYRKVIVDIYMNY